MPASAVRAGTPARADGVNRTPHPAAGTPAPAAAAWHAVAMNAYGERVEEDAAGNRRVATAEGWRREAELPAHRAARIRTAHDGWLAAGSLAVPSVSAFFGHDPEVALRAWRTVPGTPTARTPAPPTAEIEAFAVAVARARGDAAMQAWLAGRLGGRDWLPWERFLRAPNATSLRGIQAGLARRLQAVAPGLVLEQGLAAASDAASLLLPASSRLLRAASPGIMALGIDYAVQSAWTHLSARAALAPSGQQAENIETSAPDAVVLWAVGPALQALGSRVSMWWPRLAEGLRGWVVFDASEPSRSAERSLIAAMGPGHPRAARIEILDGNRFLATVWETGLPGAGFERSVSLETFAGRSPPATAALAPQVEDEQGRVPWLSPLVPPEDQDLAACAPRRLAWSMQAAFARRGIPPAHARQAIASALSASLEEVDDRLAPAQQDAVFAALENLGSARPFLLADETGFGKGRVLASAAAAAAARGQRAVFVTENDTLFSDFLRDLHAVSPGAPLPFMLHSSASLFDQQGVLLARRRGLADLRQAMEEPAPAIIVTTYATVSRKDSRDRLDWLLAQMQGGAWLILDEAHNATGDSLAATSIQSLVKAASATLYASATFAASEANLGLYATLLPRLRALCGFIRAALAADTRGRLREAVTESLAATGTLMRREHPPVPPPDTVWVEETPAIANARAALAGFWSSLLLATERRFAHEEGGPRIWLRHGAAMARTLREFSMLAKAEATARDALSLAAAGMKPVITTDSTLEAALVRTFQPDPADPSPTQEGSGEEGDDSATPPAAPKAASRPTALAGPGRAPRWSDRLRALLRETFPEDWAHAWPASPAAHHAVAEPLRQALEALEAIPSDWTLAPLDTLRERLAAAGLRCGELSGRRFRIETDGKTWRAVPRNDPGKAIVVRAFNEGDLDALVITRAGSTGISLHADRHFADTRRRAMLEWDIPANPVHRWQFRGRVHRRGEQVAPLFKTLELDTPFDRRRVEREAAKANRLSAHLGAASAPVPGWLSPPAAAAVEEWAAQFPDTAALVGIYGQAPAGQPLPTPVERASRLLARSLILPPAEAARVGARLDRALSLSSDLLARRATDPSARPCRALRRVFWWGDDRARIAGLPGLETLRVDAVERIWPAPPPADPDAMRIALESSTGEDGTAILTAMAAAWRAQCLPSTLANRRLWQAASAALRGMPRGAHISLSQAETGLCTHAMVLGVDPPPSGDFALSQIGVRLWEIGRQESEWRSLQALVRDRLFAVRAPSFDFGRLPPIAPQVALLMEGNPVAAARFGQRHGLGRRVLIEDAASGETAGWLLPATISLEGLLAMPRDLIDAEHAMAFLRHHPGEPMSAALPPGHALRAESTQGALWLTLPEADFASAQEGGWLDYRVAGLLDRVNARGNPGVTLRCATRQVPQLLHALDARGLGWRIDASHAAWYAHTSRQVLYGHPVTSNPV